MSVLWENVVIEGNDWNVKKRRVGLSFPGIDNAAEIIKTFTVDALKVTHWMNEMNSMSANPKVIIYSSGLRP